MSFIRSNFRIPLGIVLSGSLFLSACGGDSDDSGDSTPDSFTFVDQTGVALATYIKAEKIEIEGINETVDISIEDGQYSINGAAFTDDTQEDAVSNGDEIVVRVLSSDKLSTTNSTTLTVGGVSDTFSVKTVDISLSVRSAFKGLTFDWPSVQGANTYKILEKPEDADGYSQIGRTTNNSASALTLEFPIHTHDWLNAEYMLEACTVEQCSTTDPISAYSELRYAIGYLKAPNPDAFDMFANVTVSADGETLVVGAPGEDSSARSIDGDSGNNSSDSAGAVYVYRKIEGAWKFEAYLKANNADISDQFGTAMALSSDGNTLAIGAPFEDSNASGIDGDVSDNSLENAGAVYIFKRTGSTWMQTNYLKASNPDANDLFGSSLAISNAGATLTVGAPGEDSSYSPDTDTSENNDSENNGAVYVFSTAADSWEQTALLKSPNTSANNQFGFSQSLSANGNTLVVGAPFQNTMNTVDTYSSGVGYVFTRTNNVWSRINPISPNVLSNDQKFGFAVDISDDGNWIAIGAPGEQSTGTGIDSDTTLLGSTASGAVSLYAFVNESWALRHTVKSSNSDADDQFGSSVALNATGTILAVGAPGESSQAYALHGDQTDNTASRSGAAYAFVRDGTTWSQKSYLKTSNTDAGDLFGTNLSLDASGNLLLISAPGERNKNSGLSPIQTDNSLDSAGAIYFY